MLPVALSPHGQAGLVDCILSGILDGEVNVAFSFTSDVVVSQLAIDHELAIILVGPHIGEFMTR